MTAPWLLSTTTAPHVTWTPGDLAEEGRRLASEREDLIAQGVDPTDLLIPLHPDDFRRQR